ncbi:hypothetical protein P22_2245 [Propionispora sp. 2/2-37]|uniref:helix-turn-helix domain-containing protein n=1 Tax=Propionispora sp. 2/2-37 TaxID=1677858 RepID=UPI0006BB58D5|nr:RodZ domain-containing protein [Propionispora sp. 2/2-37]CUH96157.1 hypothetical protein P22_2245 [Propionispora sp. 2/2-37]
MNSVGEILRSEREKKGLSIKDVESATSIRALYIQSIEQGEFQVIPGEVYLKGFIRNYANYLGLNGQEMVNLYRQEQNPAVSQEASAETKGVSAEPSDTSGEKTESTGILKWVIILFLAIGASGAAWWFIGGTQEPEATPPPVNKQQQAAPAPAPVPVTPPTQQAPPAPAVQAKPVSVTAKFTEASWISVTIDGKNSFEGIPQAGESMTWDAQKSIAVKLGNAGGVDWVYNGQAVGKLGNKGEVVTKIFNAKQ